MSQIARTEAMPLADESASQPTATASRRISDVIQLTKPRITVMVLITTYIGFELGLQALGEGTAARIAAQGVYWRMLMLTLVGTAFSCMGSAVLNQWYERDTDALMKRTRNRPLPAQRLSSRFALLLGVGLSLLGVGLLALVHPLAAILSALTILSYVLLYTPMKRVSHLCTIVGAAPGAMPPVLGYAAATGTVGPAAWVLFAILFMWQLPHFLAIAWVYRHEYARAGLPMLPVVDPTGASTFREALLGALALLPLGLLPTMLGISGPISFYGSLLAGLAFVGFAVALITRRTVGHARAMFYASLVYLPLVLILMMLDRV